MDLRRLPELPSDVGRVVAGQRLSGGSICEAWAVRTAHGARLVVKETPYDAELEAEGLRALAAAGAPVPAVRHVAPRLLVMDEVGTDGFGDLAELGAALARAHDPAHAPDVGSGFGWHRDNLLGTCPQPNTPTAYWPTFFVEQRVRPHLAALPVDLARRLDAACERVISELLDHDVEPSLVHGDLWPGNVVADGWLVDPAVHRADAELDLATSEVFGGLSPAFQAGYESVRPLDNGWQERRPILQLPIMLAHVVMFGHSWAGAVADRLATVE